MIEGQRDQVLLDEDAGRLESDTGREDTEENVHESDGDILGEGVRVREDGRDSVLRDVDHLKEDPTVDCEVERFPYIGFGPTQLLFSWVPVVG